MRRIVYLLLPLAAASCGAPVENAAETGAEALQERHENGVPYHREVVERFKEWSKEYGVRDRLPTAT